MAQWTGQYTGRTHETKVARIEGTMKVAVESLVAASSGERDKKLRSLKQVATRLLSARLKMIGAKLEYETEARSPDQYSRCAKNLFAKEAETIEGGIEAIFEEFGVAVEAEGIHTAEQGVDPNA